MPYDVIVELVSISNLASRITQLDTGGRVIVIGRDAENAEVNIRELMRRRAKLMGATLRNRSLEEKATLVRQIERLVLPAIVRGRLRAVVEATYRFSEIDAAHKRFREGAKLGKIVLVTDDQV